MNKEFKHTANILLVDDHPENLLALEATLDHLGQNLVMATSGEEALKWLLNEDFAVILLDVQMPGMDGLETARLIRERQRNSHTPIIFITAYCDDLSIFAGYYLGAVDFLFKPIEPAILISKVKVFVELFQKTAALEQQAGQLKAMNEKLQASEITLSYINEQLENKVGMRTAELIHINACVHKEIMERQRAEATLRDREERLRLALEGAKLGMWDYDLVSGQIHWTEQCIAMFGLPPDTNITYEVFLNALHPSDREWVNETVTQAIANGEDYDIEYRSLWPDGTVHWIAAKGHAFYSENGSPIRMVGVTLDISEPPKAGPADRKRSEEALKQAHAELEVRVRERTAQLQQELRDRQRSQEALQESEERFRAAFDHASTGVALVAPDGRWLKVNPAVCEMLGYSESELLATTCFAITHPEDANEYVSCTHQMLAGQNPGFHLQQRYWHKLGYVVWVLVSASLVRDARGKPLYFVAQIEDMTKGQEIDRMKNEFISVVSHELRTPLASIRGSVGLLACGVLKNKPETAKQMLDIAVHDTERLVYLVNDILDLQRLESNKVALNRTWCDAATLMRQSVETVQSLARESCITLSFWDTPIQIWADRSRIVQTLVNLLSNAIKFSPPGSTVMLTAKPLADRVLFQVQDQGRGIPADRLETIFGPFQQVDASDSRQKGGTGLGLAICRSIVQQHGGRIWAESVLGEGSVFYLTLPIPLD